MSKSENRDSNRQAKSPASPPPPTAAAPPGPPASSLSLTVAWFLSRTMRHAVAMRKHVQKLLNHQRDVLAPQAVERIQAAIHELQLAIAAKADKPTLEKQMESLGAVAESWLKPYPNAAWRENFEVLLVALAVAMGIRTFFLQPFKIPTGSMQPSLYGVVSDNLKDKPGFKFPAGWQAVREWFEGVSYVHKVAETEGSLQAIEPPFRILIFNIWQTIVVGGKSYTIWFPPDYGSLTLGARAGLTPGQFFQKGEDIVKLRVDAGDHLFVDRITFNFRPPKRGEVVVFETKGIPEENRYTFGIPGDQFYIKRLVGMGGERIQLGNDRHLLIDGKRLDSSSPHFEKVYGFNPKDPPRDSHYSGHVSGPTLSPFFAGKTEGVEIPRDHYMVMGDNTMNSLDSRAWGYFPKKYVIGKAFFVYWPFTDRFGWGYHR